MLDIDKAKEIVCSQLLELEQQVGEPLIVVDADTIERNTCWVFFYDSRNYVETGNAIYKLAGNAPFIVDKRDWSLHATGTAEPIMNYILEYEEKHSN